MRALFTKKTFIVLIVAVLIAAIAIISINTSGSAGVVTNSVNVAMAPLRKMTASVASMFESIYGYMYDYDQVVAENERLNAQLAQLTQEYQQYMEVSEENDRLRALFDFTQRHSDYKYDTAMIIAQTSSNWSSSFTINRGSSNSDIAAGDCVITENGMLIGRVTDIGTTSSTVISILDTTFSADVLIGQSGTPGVVTGDFSLMGQGLCKIDNITDDENVLPGDTVITSGKGGILPEGLTVGNALNVQRNASGLDRYATVQPAVDFKTLTYVYLITSFEVPN